MVSAMGGGMSASDIWGQLFVQDILGLPIRDFVLTTVISRPRDIIYLVRTAVADAINRGHTIVMEEDLFSARRKYSDFAFRSVIAEDDPQKGQVRSVLFCFSRADTVLKRSEVEARIHRVVLSKEDVSFYLNLLCDLSFLGIETNRGFRFARDESEREFLLETARNAIRDEGHDEESYVINAAFYDVLQIG